MTRTVTTAAVVVTAAGCSGAPAPAGDATPAPVVTSTTGAPTSATADPVTDSPSLGAAEVNPAGDIPDNQVFVPFTTPDSAVVVSVPEGWARSSDGNATVFTDKFNSVRVEVAARATDVPQLQGSVPGFVLRGVRSVPRKGGTAVLITYEADSAVDPVTGRSVRDAVERYTFWKDGRQAALTLAGPTGADNVDPWRTVSDSLRWQA